MFIGSGDRGDLLPGEQLCGDCRGHFVECTASRDAQNDRVDSDERLIPPVVAVNGATAIATQLLARQQITTVTTTYEHYRNTRGGGREADRANIICIVSLDTAEAPLSAQPLATHSQPTLSRHIGLTGRQESTPDLGVAGSARNATTFRGLIEECRTAVNRHEAGRDEHVQGTA